MNTQALLHDTRNLAYRSPFGAVKAGTPIVLGLRTARDGASSVRLDVSQTDAGGRVILSLTKGLHRVRSSGRYDVWQTSVTPRTTGVLAYYFLIQRGKARVWYSSTPLQEGGPGQSYTSKPDVNFTITVYDPAFREPSWMANAVVYQIFPDRFYDGDRTNNARVMDPSYDGMHPTIHQNWGDAPQGVLDFFGGDLQGVVDKLPYLKALGINVLYLNPVFQAPSNHKYDTSDYFSIDPHFGTLQTFQQLVAAANANDMHVILDGVFNHTGSDSLYFNRYGHFQGLGAYQSRTSPYYSWYSFLSWPTSYASFPGADSLPQLNESAPVKDFIFRQSDSVAQHWLAQGASGWRLDAAQEKTHGWWQEFRHAIKARFPDAVLIAEDTAGAINAAPFLLGNEVDGVMNYRFRDAVLGFFARGQGSGAGVPTHVTGLYNALMSVLEDYPLPAIYSSMNLVDSHDTERILNDLGGDKRELKQVVTLQMTWLGAPTVYYGDEAGLTGGPDPDDRRTFPWGHEDTDLQSYYRQLISIRRSHAALRDGSVSSSLLDNAHRLFGYLRKDSQEQVAVVINDDDRAHVASLKLPGLANGTHLVDALTGAGHSVSGGRLKLSLPATTSVILVPAP